MVTRTTLEPATAAPRERRLRELPDRNLWLAFVLAHLWLITLNLVTPTSALGDVTGAYHSWMDQGAAGAGWIGIDLPWVYPILAAVPMLIPRIAGGAMYGELWLVMVTLLNAAVFIMLIRFCRVRGRSVAPARWWIWFLVALGPVSLGRIDAVTIPLALAGLLALSTRPALASILLTIATWVKVWPAALLLAAVVARRRAVALRIALAALGTSVVVVAGALALGSGANVVSFVGQQTDRALQVESTAALYHLWQMAAGDGRYTVYLDRRIVAFQMSGPGLDELAALLTPIMVLAVLAVMVLGILAARRGADADALIGPLALGLVAVLIVTNKVGSPQYVSWFAVPLIVMMLHAPQGSRSTSLAARIGLATAALTQTIYPYAYMQLVAAKPIMVALITLRDLGEFVLLGVAVAQLVALGRKARVSAAKPLPATGLARTPAAG